MNAMLEKFKTKFGGDIPDFKNMNRAELMKARAKYVAEAEDILSRKDRFDRQLKDSEKEEFDFYMQLVREINLELETRVDDMTVDKNNTAVFVKQAQAQAANLGQQPKKKNVVLARDEKMADAIGLKAEDKELSIGKFFKGIVTGDWRGAEREFKAMSEGSLAAGGHLVPTPLSTQIIDKARNLARVFQAGALTVPMDSQTLKLAKVTGDPSANWKLENDPIVESDMTFDAIEFRARTLAALCRMSVELFEDARNIDQVVENALAQTLALELDRAALLGDGTNEQPTGLYHTAGVQTHDMGTDGAVLTDYVPFSLAVEKVQTANGEPNAVIYAPRTAGAVDRLVDSTGQPLQPPASFANLQKLVTNQVPVDMVKGTATNASVAFVGQWNQLLIGIRTNLMVEVSRQAENAFTNLQVLIRAYLRADVQVANPEHFCVIDGIIPE